MITSRLSALLVSTATLVADLGRGLGGPGVWVDRPGEADGGIRDPAGWHAADDRGWGSTPRHPACG